ncbi:hypothetical protein J3R82DRAFT_7239, partial [Butyriboletus roseoflavus]
PVPCSRPFNQGWSHFIYTLGVLLVLLWIIRFLVFNALQSPKYLVIHAKDEVVVEINCTVASYNTKTS